MSNVIQIKRGASPPGENVLLPYELGYTVSRFLQDNTLVENSGGGYLYIGDLKQGDANTTLPVKIKAGYADTTGCLSWNDGMPREKVMTYWQGHSMDGYDSDPVYYKAEASKENCLPSSNQWWHVLRFNHSNIDQLYYTDLAIPFLDIYKGLCYKQVIDSTVIGNKWITILDESNYSNYIGSGVETTINNKVPGMITSALQGYLPLSGGTMTMKQSQNGVIDYDIIIRKFHPGGTNPSGWGTGIKFSLLDTETDRYAAIEAYANTSWAHSTGLRFKTYSNEGDGDAYGAIEATFAKGIFTAPKFSSDYATLTNLNSYKVTSNIVSAENINIIKDNKETNIYQIIYPIGSIYMSVNSTNPTVLFGGTWEQLTDRFLVGAGDSFTAGNTNGSMNHTHTLSDNAYTKINHNNSYFYFEEIQLDTTYSSTGRGYVSGEEFSRQQDYAVPLGGSTDSASNLPPYLAVYMWKRIA